MSLREGYTTWESEVVEVLKIDISPNGQSSWTEGRIISNDWDGTYTDHTSQPRNYHTIGHMWSSRNSHKTRRERLIL